MRVHHLCKVVDRLPPGCKLRIEDPKADRVKLLATLAFVISLVALTVALAGRHSSEPAVHSTAAESVYDRVMRTGTIRCAYASYPPFFQKDPNTGAMTGIFVDLMEGLGQALSLKVDWTEEVASGSVIEGLNSDRYDMYCADMWANGSRARVIDFSIPFSYAVMNAYTRADDARLPADNLAALDDPSVRIVTMDGEMGEIIARQRFPKANRVPLPQNTDYSQLLLAITTGKADVIFLEPTVVAQYEQKNGHKFRNLTPGHPVDLMPNVLAFRRGQPELKAMLDTAMRQMLNNGTIDAIMKKYEPAPGLFLPVAYPYRTEEK